MARWDDPIYRIKVLLQMDRDRLKRARPGSQEWRSFRAIVAREETMLEEYYRKAKLGIGLTQKTWEQ